VDIADDVDPEELQEISVQLGWVLPAPVARLGWILEIGGDLGRLTGRRVA
jgi:hypothetical protein